METRPRNELEQFGEMPEPVVWWRLAQDARVRLWMLAITLEWLGESALLAWRPADWPHAEWVSRQDDSAVVEFEIMKGVGVPIGSDALLCADQSDYGSLLTLAYCAADLGWAPTHDLFLFAPIAGRLARVTHHDALGVVADPQSIESLVEQFTAAGHEPDR
jgi:hypothetical protein